MYINNRPIDFEIFNFLARANNNVFSHTRFHDEWTDLKFVEDIPVIDHYDYKKSKVYHAAVDFGDVVVKSINIDHLRVRKL